MLLVCDLHITVCVSLDVPSEYSVSTSKKKQHFPLIIKGVVTGYTSFQGT